MAWTWTIPTARCKTISSWLVLVRVLQALGTLLCLTLNGWLLVYIRINSDKHEVPETVIALELMACMAFIYSVIVLLVMHSARIRRRDTTTKTIGTFIACDILCVGLAIATITVLARSGVPATCHRLIKYNSEDDISYDHRRSFLSARSGDDDDHEDDRGDDRDDDKSVKNMLDRYCAVERAFYCIVIILIFSYIVSIILSVLRILKPIYMKAGRTNDPFATLDNAHQLEHIGSKTYRPKSIADVDDLSSPIQGVIPAGVASSSSLPTSRIISNHSRSHPASPTPAVSVSTLPALPSREPNIHGTFPVSPITLPTRSPIAPPVDQNRPVENLGAYHDTMDHVAEAAMITDGYRHSTMSGFTSLPPYTPGPSRQFMDGHGNESNEMRLSEYVKGQTRAQNMKDAGGGF